MTNHTPTPWMVDETMLCEVGIFAVNGPEDAITVDIQPENAAFIVRAVNAHEELLRVAKMIYESENEQDKFAEPWMIELGEAIAKAEAL